MWLEMLECGYDALQTYISMLDEDLGRAQARLDAILSAEGGSTSKQNELLKAAAKQVTLPQGLHLFLTTAKSTQMKRQMYTDIHTYRYVHLVCH